MKRPSKELIVSAVAVLGIAAFVLAGLALKPVILEQWYIWKLDSEDEEERKLAAEKLGEMGLVTAVPVILGIFQRTGSAVLTMVSPVSYVDTSHAFVVKPDYMFTIPSDGNRLDADGQAASVWLVPDDSIFLVDALWNLTGVTGKKSIPYLVTALDDDGWYVAYLAASLLGRIGPDARGASPALATALRHESELVRNAAADALKKIRGDVSR